MKIFTPDLKDAYKNRPSGQQAQHGGRQRKIPKYLESKIGNATNLYAFGKYDEAIPLFEDVIKEMPELADITQIMSLIYKEKGDLEKSFMFAFLSANETRTDS